MNKYLLIVPFLLSNSVSLCAQTVSSVKDIEISLKASEMLLADGKQEEYIDKSREILESSKKIHYSKGVALASYRIAMALMYQKQTAKSLEYLKLSEGEIYTKQNPEQQFNILKVTGQIYAAVNEYDEALKEYRKMLIISEKIPDAESSAFYKSMSYNNIAVMYGRKQNNDSTLYYYNKARYFLAKLKITNRKTEILKSYINGNIGEIKYMQHQNDSAKYYLKEALKVAPQNRTGSTIVFPFKYLSNIYFDEGDYKNAKISNDSAIIYAEKLNDLANLKYLYELRFKISEKQKKLPEAQKELKELVKLKDSISTLEKENIEEPFKHIVNRKNIEIQAEKRQSNIVLWWAALAISLLLLTLFFLFRRKKNLEKENFKNTREIKEKHDEVENLKIRINEAFEEVVQLAKDNNPEFMIRFREIYPEFCDSLLKMYPDINNETLKFCGLLKLNFSTKDISQYTFVTPRAVQIRKNRLRKKLNIPSDQDIYLWMNEI